MSHVEAATTRLPTTKIQKVSSKGLPCMCVLAEARPETRHITLGAICRAAGIESECADNSLHVQRDSVRLHNDEHCGALQHQLQLIRPPYYYLTGFSYPYFSLICYFIYRVGSKFSHISYLCFVIVQKVLLGCLVSGQNNAGERAVSLLAYLLLWAPHLLHSILLVVLTRESHLHDLTGWSWHGMQA